MLRTIDPVIQQRCALLELLPGLNRGTIANAEQRAEIAGAIARLEDAAYVANVDSLTMEGRLGGKWQLIYTTVVWCELSRCRMRTCTNE
jgi:hypothetical protein